MRRRILAQAICLLVLFQAPPLARGGSLWASSAVVLPIRPLAADVFDKYTGHRVKYNICTAFAVDETRRLWLTAAHCLWGEQQNRYLVLAWSIDAHAALPLRIDDASDLALLVTADYAVPGLVIASTAPGLEDIVEVIGYPLGGASPVTSVGSIVALDTLMHVDCNLDDRGRARGYLVVTAAILPGNSGSPILNAAGQVIGVVQIGCHYHEQWAVGGGSPHGALVDFLHRAVDLGHRADAQ